MSTENSTVIFIVDDNPANVKVLSKVLESFGYKTLVAMDGLSGIQKITKSQPDLILLDVLMPNIDGFETCQRLKQSETTSDIPIVFMTALASTADKVKGLSLGAVDYITKPFQKEELIVRLELHLKLRRLTQSLATQNQQLQIEIVERKKAEEQIKILSKVSEQSPALIVITDTQGDITYVNPKFEEITGYTLEELIGQNPRILKSGDTTEQEYAMLWENITSGNQWHGEFHNRKRNGELYWELASISPIKDANGEITHFVAIKEDITLRKQKELELQQQLEREKIITNLTLNIRQSLDLSIILNTAVTELRRVLKVDRILVYCLMPDGSGKMVAESVSNQLGKMVDAVLSSEIFTQEVYSYYKEGKVYSIDDLDNTEILPCGKDFLRNLGIEAKLVAPIVQKNNLWGLLVAHHSQKHYWQDWESEFFGQVSNQMAIAISQANLYQQLQIELQEKIQAENALQVLNQELENRVEQRTIDLKRSELQVQKELEERKQVEIQLQKNNEQLALANIELARATRLKDEFLANMSHELRTPLNAILGLSESLKEGMLGEISDRQKKAITTIESGGQHLLSLITDILDLAKIESGKLELHTECIEIEKICSDSLIFVRQIALKKDIRLVLNIAPYLRQPQFAYINVDELRIRQALINLLTNAVKFTPDGGSVTLEAKITPITDVDDTHKNYIDFLVTDTGIGIAKEDMSKLFQTFMQIDSALNRKYAGTGLGLSLVKKIAEMHEGSVNVESEVERGSTFRLRLPYQQGLGTSDKSENLQVLTQEGLEDSTNRDESSKILIVEDNLLNIESMRSYLESRKYQIYLAANGKTAIDMAIAEKPDIILMDIQMPEMDGLMAIKLIRANPEIKDIPIIALTALAMQGDRERCLEVGASEYLTKPFKFKSLFQMIQSFLNK
ncbi:response regulator [Pseudanabaena biceps]|nr:response regulator [Pseudanabaena biceps]